MRGGAGEVSWWKSVLARGGIVVALPSLALVGDGNEADGRLPAFATSHALANLCNIMQGFDWNLLLKFNRIVYRGTCGAFCHNCGVAVLEPPETRSKRILRRTILLCYLKRTVNKKLNQKRKKISFDFFLSIFGFFSQV